MAGKSKLEMQIRIDLKEVMKGIETVNNKLNVLFGRTTETVTIDADTSGAIAGAGEVEGALDSVPDQKEIFFDSNAEDVLGGLAKLSLAVQGITRAYSAVSGKVSELIGYSNIQEQAEMRLTSALRVRGEATQQNIDMLIDLATATQAATVVGDEQSLALLTLATNMGVATNQLESSLQGAIGLSTAFAGAGLSAETAMKGIALAMEGEYTQLGRYIPALRAANSDTEKMAILQEAMANGFQMAKDETESGAGAMQQFSNQVGDLKEQLGDIVKSVLLPLVRILNNVVTFMNDFPGLTKAIVAGLGAIVVWITYLKMQQIALNTALAIGSALAGNWIGLAAAATAGVGIWAVSSSLMSGEQAGLNSSLQAGTEALSAFSAEMGNFNASTLKTSQTQNLQEINKLNSLIEEARQERERMKEDPSQDPFISGKNREIRDLLARKNALIANNKDIEQQLSEHYASQREIQQSYYDWKKNADYMASLDNISLAKYNLAQAEAEYKALNELDEESLGKKKELYNQILSFRNQIVSQEEALVQKQKAEELRLEAQSLQEKKQLLTQEKMDLVQYYADISQLGSTNIEQMKQDFGRYLAKVKAVFGSESVEFQKAKNELLKIEKSTNDRLIQEKNAFNSQVAGLSQDRVDKDIEERNRLLQELKKHYQEGTEEYQKYMDMINQSTIESVEKRYETEEEGLETKIRDVEEYFAKYRAMLLEAGRTEEEIETAKQRAINNLRKEQLTSSVAIGAKLMTAYQGQSQAMFSMGKGLSIAQATISGFEAVTRAYKDYPFPMNMVVAGFQGSLATAQIANIKETKFVPKAETGGYIRGKSHAHGGTIIEAEDGEYITRTSRVRELGADFFHFLNNAPLNMVKGFIGGVSGPSIPAPASAPRFAYATGGQVTSGSNSMIDSLIEEVKMLRQEFREKKLEVNNYISANDVIDKADSTKINEKNEDGGFVRSRW